VLGLNIAKNVDAKHCVATLALTLSPQNGKSTRIKSSSQNTLCCLSVAQLISPSVDPLLGDPTFEQVSPTHDLLGCRQTSQVLRHSELLSRQGTILSRRSLHLGVNGKPKLDDNQWVSILCRWRAHVGGHRRKIRIAPN